MPDIIVHDSGPVRVIRMNRPAKKNALTQEMYASIVDAIDRSADDDDIRCLVLAGVEGAFTAGNDLADFKARGDAEEGPRPPSGGELLLRALMRNGKPLVAAVDGIAVGIGMTLVFHCDYVVATEATSFSTPFVSLGLVPEGGSTLLMPKALGYQKAFEMLVLGQRMDGRAAYEAGFVNQLAASGTAEAEAIGIARKIAALPVRSVALTRQMLRLPEAELAARVDLEIALFNDRICSPEAQASFERFLTPRPV